MRRNDKGAQPASRRGQPPGRGRCCGAGRGLVMRGVCFIASQGKSRRLAPATAMKRRRAPSTWAPFAFSLAGQRPRPEVTGKTVSARGTTPGTGRGGVSVWTPLRGASHLPNGRTPPGSRKDCHSTYGPPPFSGDPYVSTRAGRHRADDRSTGPLPSPRRRLRRPRRGSARPTGRRRSCRPCG